MKLELTELITSLGLTVAKAQQEMETNAIGNFLNYFDTHSVSADAETSTNSALDAKTLKINIPYGNATKTVSVPVAALALHNSLDLEEVIFKLNVRPTVEDQNVICCNVNALEATEETDAENNSSMELIFKRNAPSEGIARLYTELCKTI